MLVMVLPSHAGNGATTQGCTCRVKVVQPPSSEHRGVVVVQRSSIGMPMINDVHVGSYSSDSRQNIIA
jgi:hypothetical protein